MRQKTVFNQFLSEVKSRIYPNRIVKRRQIHPALQAKLWDTPRKIARGPKLDDISLAGSEFSQDWFLGRAPWLRFLAPYQDQVRQYLEIGSFEGRSALFAGNLFPKAALTCVDTFRGSDEHSQENISSMEERFRRNIAPIKDRVTVLKGTSLQKLAELSEKTEVFDVIYVDGSHFYRHVLLDTLMSWPLLKVGGFLIWDDYGWDFPPYKGLNPKPAIDHFLTTYAGHYEVLFVTDQVAVRKTKSEGMFLEENGMLS